jgi:pimeloyl-ACP methyl ester carboxylesterase
MKTKPLFPLVILFAIAAVGCGEPGPVDPASESLAPTFAKVTGPAEVEGEIGPGALYGLYLPAEWNGDLVLYAHGYRSLSAPITLPGGGANGLRDALLGLGYGVAWSSYSENGYAIKDGLIRTRQLRGLFTSNFGRPSRTYLMGHSLGGIVTLMAAEKHPGLFAGALPMCSLVGGGPMEVDYIYNVRALFDYYFPGALPGDAVNVPDGLDFGTQVIPAVVNAVVNDWPAAFEMAAVDQIELPFTSPGELLNSIISALFFNIVGTEDFIDRTRRGFFGNSTTVYSGSADDIALNAGVDRFEATPSARNYLEHWYLPTGRLEIPVLTLHTTMDPVVPFFHEPAYEAIVDAAGNSDLLVQRAVDRYGHCALSGPETVAAFLDLVNWVETGVAPTP